MPLRHPLSAACLAALMAPLILAPLPAAAHERDRDRDDIARRLSDPGTQAAVTVALTALSESLLDMNVEPIRRAMAAAGDDAAADMPRDTRLRDLAGPEADRLPSEIGHSVPRAMGAAASMADAVHDMVPQINAMADRLRHAIPRQ